MTATKRYSISSGFVLLLFCFNNIHAQNIPDSLLQKLNNSTNDSVRARTLLDVGEAIEETTPAKSMDYYQQALALSKKIKNNHLILSSFNDVGICNIEMNKWDSAIIALEQAIHVGWILNDTFRVAKITVNVGNVYLHQNSRIKAIDYYLQSARLWETCKDQEHLSMLYCNISMLFTNQEEYEKALEYGNKAVTLAKKNVDTVSIVNSLINLSDAYGYMEQRDKEYQLLEEALPMAIKYGDPNQIATVYHDMGGCYYGKKDYPASLKNYLESYTYVKQLGNLYHLCTACSALAQVYYKLNQNDKALQYILQAEKLAGEVGARADLKEIYMTRAEVEQQAGNYKVAAEYFSKTLELSDSLFKVATSEKVADVEAKYQNEKKQKEIVQLGKDKEIQSLTIKEKSILNYFLIAAVAILLIIGFLAYRNIRHRQSLAKKETELQVQRIQSLEKDKQLIAVDSMLKGEESERSRLAKDLHDGLGGLLSGVKFSLSNMKDNFIVTPENMSVFERSLDMIDASIKELRRVAYNMMPEMLVKFGLDEALREYCIMVNSTKLISVKYQSYGMNTRLDNSIEIIIYRIVQELLNNTLKHAAATEALVQLVKEENRCNIMVEDNGKGFDIAILESGKGSGWMSIRSRVDYLKGHMETHSEPGKGTSVSIEFII